MDSRPLPGEQPARLCPRRYLSEHVVLPVAGARCVGPADAHPRHRAGVPAVRLCPHLGPAPARRLAGQPETGPPPLPLGRPPGAPADASEKAREPARGVVPPASGRHQRWSMDVVHDQLASGRAFRVLTVIDQWSRESVRLEANVSLTGRSVVDALEAVAAERPLPRAITGDHGRPRYGVHVERPGRVGLPPWGHPGLHPARKARGERVYREFQRPPAR